MTKPIVRRTPPGTRTHCYCGLERPCIDHGPTAVRPGQPTPYDTPAPARQP